MWAGSPGQEEPGPDPHPGASLRVVLVTAGQGDAVWERFGHTALWIQDEETGRGAAYNWGIFDFGQVNFMGRLIRGTMLYRMAPLDPFASLEEYRAAGRRVWLQELDLTPAQRLNLLAFVQWNALPENRDYHYDYYRDNCSTRVRDALDRVLEGALRETMEAVPTEDSYRWHTRRLLQDVPWAYAGIQVVLGPRADAPLTAWDEMFLPRGLMCRLSEMEIRGPEGGLRPLVKEERLFLESSRPPAPEEPPLALPWFLSLAVLWGGAILLLVRGGGEVGWGRRLALTVLAGGWALVAAALGVLILGAWIFTDHVFWHHNYNLLQVNPLFLPLPFAFVWYLVRGRFPRWAREMAAALAVVAVVGALMQLLPGLGQANGELLALTVPMDLALGWAAVVLASTPGTDTR